MKCFALPNCSCEQWEKAGVEFHKRVGERRHLGLPSSLLNLLSAQKVVYTTKKNEFLFPSDPKMLQHSAQFMISWFSFARWKEMTSYRMNKLEFVLF